MSPRAIMIFAAGLGTRMGALTFDRPKPLIEVAGRPLIDHALALTEPLMPLTRVVNLHYRGDMLRAHLGNRVTFSDESARLLDTGGGLRAALPLLGPGPVFTLNSDAVWTGSNPLATLAAAWMPERMDALVHLVPNDRATGHQGGDFSLAPGGRVGRGGSFVYTGAQIVNPARLDGLAADVFSLNALWDILIAEGRLHGVVHAGGWCDVGRPESIALAEDLLASAHAD